MIKKLLSAFLIVCLSFSVVGCSAQEANAPSPIVSQDDIPAFTDQAYVVLNNNVPTFTEDEITDQSFETYYPLDDLGRVTGAFASIGTDLLPTKERGNISSVKPTGWHSVQYDNVEGKSLYNRCHLIAWSLTGEDANPNNLITGTRYLNIEGMKPFEDMTRDYIKETGNHVMYRVIPVYTGNNLVADGVIMEGYSVEDNGEGIEFNVYAYNEQPGITIDHATGDSALSKEETDSSTNQNTQGTYVINKSTKKIHDPSCSSVSNMKEENKEFYRGNLQDLLNQGYTIHNQCLGNK
ncbi:hypothetical protein C815_01079 [Firmicutes bacterium M10-2]|nr:hypothetical protein C815_01079 [Firmicutes bacterium M10-2]